MTILQGACLLFPFKNRTSSRILVTIKENLPFPFLASDLRVISRCLIHTFENKGASTVRSLCHVQVTPHSRVSE